MIIGVIFEVCVLVLVFVSLWKIDVIILVCVVLDF